MKFTKMHGAGNDYIYIDCFANPVPNDIPQLAQKMSHRHFGVGGDGLVLIRPSERADAWMQMFNADGSESEMCGNAIRCVAKLVYQRGIARKERMTIQTGAGDLTLDLEVSDDSIVERVTVDMGEPILEASEVPTTIVPSRQVVDHEVTFDGRTFRVTCVSMGNPHCVIFVDEATDDLVLGLGPKIENDPRFPRRTNVEFVEVIDRTHLRQRTWERGSGETWACGTGASAVCVAGVLTGRTERAVEIQLLGGLLKLRWDDNTNHVFKTGGATEVFSGVWEQ
ncbi:Diaminopimelate epimerase [Rubripirellula amarantea]|uniref:Diaminopimelate epimerase n=1 Tax=Rubripirellula amarantea TaxID=2527999 RepID=A0A5C5WTT9_9BACT|nr:diaminopimelate epimerase [Rubripirellula amarantea]TWT54096.1 Diaminopimelate epimerase [Rubripirellula amarantea]